MRSRLSIFSSRILGSALVWTVLAAALVEAWAGRALPARFYNHEVDQLLDLLDRGSGSDADMVFLGDSVGRQVSRALALAEPDFFLPLASNGGIETAGQYFVLRRYLARHPAPKRVVLMMLNPVEGLLDGKYTENYFQRGFLHGDEIAAVAPLRRSLPFTLTMVGYRLSPVFRYRIGLQAVVPWLETPSPWSGQFAAAEIVGQPPEIPKHGLLDLGGKWLKRFRRGPQISAVFFDRLAALMEARGIEWLFLPPPLPASSAGGGPTGVFGRQLAQVVACQDRYPALRVHAAFQIYPDDWFADEIHLKAERLPAVARDYAEILRAQDFGPAAP